MKKLIINSVYKSDDVITLIRILKDQGFDGEAVKIVQEGDKAIIEENRHGLSIVTEIEIDS